MPISDLETSDAETTGVDSGDYRFTDEELCAQALAADPDDVLVDPDAEPFGGSSTVAGLLPAWYMATPMGSGSAPRGRRVVIASVLVLSMLVVNAAGICVTYGIPEVGDRVTSLFG